MIEPFQDFSPREKGRRGTEVKTIEGIREPNLAERIKRIITEQCGRRRIRTTTAERSNLITKR